eukprot:TRINITY_DN5721_c0_g1_i8.p1 TRINITY_DN5721_c0_g1~~TRINITY_DN5721_c0_g1_i8.p1  ORF type:complete len:147 (+),score=24.90 TRINITY_DN5721_c0_g1_i8:190-630(+)
MALVKGFDVLHKGSVLVLLQTVQSYQGVALPEQSPHRVRMHLNAGFLLTPVTKAQTKVTSLSSLDPSWIFPTFSPVRNWVALQLFTSIFLLFRERAQKVAGSDLEGWMESQPDLYGFLERRTSEYIDGLDLTTRASGAIDPNSILL